jgi:putative peptidoglycan lipid II flippase
MSALPDAQRRDGSEPTPEVAAPPGRHVLITGARVTSLGTMASRVLGMIRDMATAALFGMSHGGVMDAFVVAFRIPNTFRRLFGEGALAASYLPVLAAELEAGRAQAWRLTSVMLATLALLLAGVVLVIEIGCGLMGLVWGHVPGMSLVLGLTAVMMPYMLFICMAAQAAATLQALGHFSIPALAPTMLNLCWLGGVWLVAPWFADKHQQAFAVAGAVLVSGVLQLVMQLAMLRRFGFRFDYDWAAARPAMRQIATAMLPMTLGLAVTQLNTLVDSLIAWGLAAAPGESEWIGWLGSAVRYPLRQGAAASIYYGERLYELPLALLGIAVATAIYPLLSRHAARNDHRALAADLTLGLRLVLFLGLPASAGLVLLAEPLSRLLFQHGQFTADDALRASRVIACYACGVWAYCASPVVVRGYYALGDRATPVWTGLWMVGLNLVLNLTLIWWLAECGLAVATTMAAIVQAVILTFRFSRFQIALDWPALAGTGLRALLATGAMTVAGLAALAAAPGGLSVPARLAQVAFPLLAAVGVYFAVYRLLGGRELGMLLSGSVPEEG